MNRLWTWLITLLLFVALGALGTGILALEKPVGAMTGQVTSDGGEPLTDAKVTAYGPARRTIRVDEQGRFRFDRLPVGRYELSAQMRGYERQWHSPAVDIKEGGTVSGLAFKLVPVKPQLYFSQYQRVFTPDEALRVSYRGTLVDKLHVRLYRTDLADVAYRKHQRPKAQDLIREWEQPVVAGTATDDDWFYRQLAVDGQGPGFYRLVMSGSGEVRGKSFRTDETSTWINVSRLALVVKRTPSELLVYATDLVSKAPVAGVAIQSGDAAQRLQTIGQTDSDGLLRIAATGSIRTIVGRLGDSTAFMDLYAPSPPQRLAGYVYTDRPIYRPAQTVHIKAVLRQRQAETLTVPAGMPVTLTITDPQGQKAFQTDLVASDWGSVATDFELPGTAALGEYSLHLSWAKESIDGSFQVAAYRKPEFRLDITPSARQVIKGEPLRATIDAAYYFGAPVAGKKLHYTVYRSPASPWYSEEDWFYSGYRGGGDEYFWGYGDVVTSGEGVTDEAGHFALVVPTDGQQARLPGEPLIEERYTIEVQATDDTRRTVTSRDTVTVAPSELRLQVEPTSYLFQPGDEATFRLNGRNLAGQPEGGRVTGVLYRDVPARSNADGEIESERKLDEIATVTGEVDDKGIGWLKVQVPSEGSYLMEVRGRDRAGRPAVSVAHIWVSATDYGGGSSYRYGAMQVVFDKQRYKVGETANVFIARPTSGVPVLVTVEGQAIYQARVMRAQGASLTLQVPVTAQFSPNAFVVATMVDGKAFHQAERSLNVLPTDKFLTVNVKSDRERYGPGETVTLRVTTTNARGEGVPAEVSVGVVDQAIYALAPDTTPDPRRVFHGPRPNTVDTFYSFSEDYSGGANKDLAEPRLRKHFLDTAAWFPSVRTDAKGQASVSFQLPDNLTTWIVTARGQTKQTEVGATTTSFLETQDVLVRLATPRFMVEGDRLSLVGLVHNYLPDAIDVRTWLKAAGLALKGATERQAAIVSGGVAKVDFDVAAEQVGKGQLTLTATSPQGGDALELSVPVLPHGTPDVVTQTGISTSDTTLTVEVPAGAVPGTTTLSIDLTPTPLGAVAAALDYLRQYPYGCIEQTLNRYVPEIVAAPLLGETPDDKRIREGLVHIANQQHGDGGWGWWANDASDITWTAYVLMALDEVRQAGYDVPETMVRPAIAYLHRQVPKLGKDAISPQRIVRNAGADQQALVQLALSRWDEANYRLVEGITRQSDYLSTQGRAMLVLALDNVGNKRAAREQFAILARQAVRTGSQVHWESRDASEWFDNPIEATSYALQAMMRIEPQHDLAQPAVRYLMTERRDMRWRSTKDTAAAILALSAYARAHGTVPEPMPVTLTLDGTVLAEVDLQAPQLWRTGYRMSVDSDRLTPGRHQLTIDRMDDGTRELPYSVTRSSVVRADRITAKDGPQLAITRTYRLITPADRQKHPEWLISDWFKAEQAADLREVRGAVRTGNLILVELRVDNGTPRSYVMLEDPLPAGMEVATDRGLDDPWQFWWSQREVHDDRVAFFMTYLPKGKHRLYYVIRPEIPGEMRALPPRIAEMYAPDVWARGAETAFTVRP